jgi:hypothetical protein
MKPSDNMYSPLCNYKKGLQLKVIEFQIEPSHMVTIEHNINNY